MTKKDYILIAGAILDQRYAIGNDNIGSSKALSELSLVLAGKMAEQNSKFDRERFLKACGTAMFSWKKLLDK